MSKDNSPMYALGVDDGLRDTDLVRNHLAPRGPQPPLPKYPVMYMTGYDEAYDPSPDDSEEA